MVLLVEAVGLLTRGFVAASIPRNLSRKSPMRVGRFPSQAEALREQIARELSGRMRRRTFLAGLAGLALGAAAGGATAYGLMPAGRHPQLEFARTLAVGPWNDLEAQYSVLLDVIDLAGGDRVLWGGARRLAEHALRAQGSRAERIARALYRTLSHARAPADLVALRIELRRRGGLEDAPSRTRSIERRGK